MTDLPPDIEEQVLFALKEDIGNGDVTAQLISESSVANAQLIVRENAIICGIPWWNMVFQKLDQKIITKWTVRDGDNVEAGDILSTITGSARAILTGERTALNFLQTLSGTATATQRFAKQLVDHNTRLLDTRKTIPGLRNAQKYATRIGGALNHRIGLYDAFLIKENHIAAAGSITQAVISAKQQHPDLFLEVEVESMEQLAECVENRVDRVLLDNFTSEMTAEAVQQFGKEIQLEASGNIDEKNLQELAATGIHYISSGALTKHIRAVDFSLRFLD